MIDIQDYGEKMQQPLSPSKKEPIRNRSSNGRFKSIKKGASHTSKKYHCKESEEGRGNNEKALETTILSNIEQSTSPEVSSISTCSNTRISRRQSDGVPNDYIYTPELLSVGSLNCNQSVEEARKKRRGMTDSKTSSNPEVTSKKKSLGGSLASYVEQAPTKHVHTRAAGFTYLPKEERYITTQRLDALRDEYRKLSSQVGNWYSEIRRLTEPEKVEKPTEKEIIPLIVQRPQRTRRKPNRILYDL